MFVHHTGQEHGREERAKDTDNQGGSKAPDRTGTEVEQDDTGQDRSGIGVDNGREGIRITFSQCLARSLAGFQLFLGTFIDQHVGIDRHTERQHHTGDTRHGQGGLERRQNTQREEEVHEQGTVGNHTRNHAVHGTHIDHQENQGHDE